MSSSLRTTRKRASVSRSPRQARQSPRHRPVPNGKASSDFRVRFWGVRGSIPAPGPGTSRFGGNTSCVEVRCGDALIIFDAGSGIRQLGETLAPPVTAPILLSHYHYDHLQGLPFFVPLFNPANAFTFYGAAWNGKTVREVLAGQMQQPYFPVTAEMVFRAKVDYRTVAGGDVLQFGEARVSTLSLNHPGGTLGYRIDFRGRSLVYATDIEHGTAVDERLAAFAQGTDLLIYDAMYTDDEYQGRVGPPKTGWGHSTWQASITAAERANAKRLVLFHHEPTRDDADMERMLRAIHKLRKGVDAARESQIISL